METHIVDASNLLCPLPVIRLQQAVNRVPKGTTIAVICSDPGVEEDIPAWCEVHGHEYIKTEKEKNKLTLFVKTC